VKGPGGKKPASAATNLIGKETTRIEWQEIDLNFNSWWRSWNDGSARVPPVRFASRRQAMLN
jgi:hypothetical protein